MSPDATARLRALRDCGALRVGTGYAGVEELARNDMIAWKQAGEDKADCTLTDFGKQIAATLPPQKARPRR